MNSGLPEMCASVCKRYTALFPYGGGGGGGGASELCGGSPGQEVLEKYTENLLRHLII